MLLSLSNKMISCSLPFIRFASNNYLNALCVRQLCSYNYNYSVCGKLNANERYMNSLFTNARNVGIVGNVGNDGNVGVRTLSSIHNHSKIWRYERYLSVTLLAVIPVSLLVSPSLPALDYALALSLVTHIHWGVEAIVVDYVRPSIFGATIPKISIASLYLLSILSIAGLFYFNNTDVGLVNAIRMIAKL